MPRRIVISGYYGFGNTGDEAVLAGMLAAFLQLGMNPDITVLSADPKRTQAEHPGVRAVHRYSLGGMIRAMRRADLVISGGGSLLQDVTSARSAEYYLFILKLAQFLKRPTMVYAQGVGPLVRPSVRRSAARVLNRTRIITVRDNDSMILLESIGVSVPEIHVTADPSFLVEPDIDAAERILHELGLGGKPLIGVCLRPWMQNQWLQATLDGISGACDELGVTPIVIPMQESEDSETGEGLKSGAWIRGVRDVRVIKGVIAGCGVIVGMRLHSLIFASDVGVPFVPIIYDPKVAAFAGSMGYEPGIDVMSLDTLKLRNAILQAWQKREAISASMGEKVLSMRENALKSGELVKQFLDRVQEH